MHSDCVTNSSVYTKLLHWMLLTVKDLHQVKCLLLSVALRLSVILQIYAEYIWGNDIK